MGHSSAFVCVRPATYLTAPIARGILKVSMLLPTPPSARVHKERGDSYRAAGYNNLRGVTL